VGDAGVTSFATSSAKATEVKESYGGQSPPPPRLRRTRKASVGDAGNLTTPQEAKGLQHGNTN